MATLEEVQNVGYYILCTLDDICKEKNLKFVLNFGTCLGAVRHNGFIPWDDDIDLMMTCKQIKKLKKYFKKHENNVNGVSFSDFELDHETPYCLNKIRYNASCTPAAKFGNLKLNRGIGLDIFEYCYCAKSPKMKAVQEYLYGLLLTLHEKYMMRDRVACGLQSADLYNTLVYKLIEKVPECFRILTIKFIKNLMCLIGSKKSGKYFAMSDYIRIVRTPDIDIFDETVDHIFIDRAFKIPKNYDKYLTICYGDYMVPNESQHLDVSKMIIYIDPNKRKEELYNIAEEG